MNVTFEVRATKVSDAEIIGPLLRRVWLDTYTDIITEAELLEMSYRLHTPERIAAEAVDENVASYVATIDHKIVGIVRSDLKDSGVVYVGRLYIDTVYQGLGIGSALFGLAEVHFRDADTVTLDVYEDNLNAIEFYKLHGYEVLSRQTNMQSQGQDIFELHMGKILT